MADIIVVIRYHCWWPGADDPYYNYNTSENRARVNYYGADYTPHLYIDGNIDANYNYGSWGTRFMNEADVWSPLIMDITGSYDWDAREGAFTVNIYAELDPGASNMKLRIALVEDNINWHAPNGTNIHNQTFRDMIPNPAGIGVDIRAQGESFEYSDTFTMADPAQDRNCMLVAFVQNDLNRNILQGAKIPINDLTPTSVDEQAPIPEVIGLAQNYPNPFNADTKISFNTAGGSARLEVFDLTGAKVKTLVNGDMEAGTYSVVWNGESDSGEQVSSGVYFYRLTDSEGQRARRMTLLK